MGSCHAYLSPQLPHACSHTMFNSRNQCCGERGLPQFCPQLHCNAIRRECDSVVSMAMCWRGDEDKQCSARRDGERGRLRLQSTLQIVSKSEHGAYCSNARRSPTLNVLEDVDNWMMDDPPLLSHTIPVKRQGWKMSINGLFVFHKMPKIDEVALVYGLVYSYYNAPANQPEIYTGVICWKRFALERTVSPVMIRRFHTTLLEWSSFSFLWIERTDDDEQPAVRYCCSAASSPRGWLTDVGKFRCSSMGICKALCDIACNRGYTNIIWFCGP